MALESGENWTLDDVKYMSMEDLCIFENNDGLDTDSDDVIAENHCNNIECDLCFKIGNSMWKNCRGVFDDHMKYINNNIQKTYKVRFLH